MEARFVLLLQVNYKVSSRNQWLKPVEVGAGDAPIAVAPSVSGRLLLA